MTSNYKIQKKGFTLIETLVAVLLLVTAVAGPLTIVSKNLLAARVAKDQITAYYLAQDALEYVRFARDTNRLKGADWLSGAGGTSAGVNLTPCTGANGCYLDSTSNTPAVPTACSGTCPVINYSSATERFTYAPVGSGISPTQFTRTITVGAPTGSPPDERILIVTVRWGSATGAGARTVTIQENIYNWQ